MPRVFINKLSARFVATAPAGMHADGGGLYLQVTPSGARSWIFRYARGTTTSASGRARPKTRDMGLGPVHTVSLAQARESALAARQLLRTGLDPITHRRAAHAIAAGIPTFKAAALDYIETHRKAWTNAKHADQWTNTLTTYAFPHIGEKRVDHIETDDLLTILKPLWTAKTETATRLRQRIESVLDACTAKKQRSGDNPARWKGHLDTLLPKPSDVAQVKHHPAMPYKELPAFIKKLRANPSVSARALEFLILTASRTGPIIQANHPEIARHEDFGVLWTVPAAHMKSGKKSGEPHYVPVTPAMQRVLDATPVEERNAALFPGGRHSHLSNGAMDQLLDGMGYGQYTVHGFRSSFKDWASEQTEIANEVSEGVLAHTIKSKVEAAYRRGPMLQRRRDLLDAWCAFLDGKAVKPSRGRDAPSASQSKRRSRTLPSAKRHRS